MNLSKQISFRGVSFVDKLMFTKHLSVMVKAGIPLSDAILTLKEQSNNPKFKDTMTGVLSDVENGQSLAKSLGKYPKIFDSFYLNLIHIGEESGNLEENLDYLSTQLKKTYELKKKIQGAATYPLIVLVTALLIGGSIALFVLPKLTDFFSSFEVELPLSTKILLFLANLMKNYGVLIVLGVLALGVGIVYLINTVFKRAWDRFLITVPIAGPFIRSVILSSICRNLGIMLKSGLPIRQTLHAQAQASENFVYRKYLENIEEAVSRGKSIESEIVSGKYTHFPPIFGRMIGVGERTGKLDETLLYLADFFEEDSDNSAKNFSNILEPVMLLGIALVVVFIALSIITPIYELTGSIKR